MANIKSVRERIMVQVEKNITALKDDSGSRFFDTIHRTPLERQDTLEERAIGINIISDNIAVFETGWLERNMIIGMDMWVRGDLGGYEPETLLNDMSYRVEKTMLEKRKLFEEGSNDQLGLNTQILSAEYDIDGPRDKFVSVYAQFLITYRHEKNDPAKLM